MRLVRNITEKNRADLIQAVRDAPLGTTLELVDDPRTTAQNKLMWTMLGELAAHVKIGGDYHDAEAWKCAFLKAMGKRLSFMPSLDGQSVVCIGYRSSHLNKQEFSDLIEMIAQYVSEHGVDAGDAA